MNNFLAEDIRIICIIFISVQNIEVRVLRSSNLPIRISIVKKCWFNIQCETCAKHVFEPELFADTSLTSRLQSN